MVYPLIPSDANVVLLGGDAEYDTVDMLNWVQDHTHWHYVIRIGPRNKLNKDFHQYTKRRPFQTVCWLADSLLRMG